MKKRPLVVGAILFFVGVMLIYWKLSALITLFFIILLCLSRNINARRKKLLWLLFIVIYLGAVRMSFAQVYKDNIISRYAGESKEMSLVIAEPTKDGKAVAFLCDDENAKVYLSVKRRAELFCGDIVTGEITLNAPFEAKLGTSSFSNHLASLGVYLQANADSVQITGRYKEGIMGNIYSLRRYMDSLGERLFKEDRRALFNAMIFGDKSLISDELYASLQGSGLNHIAVVSGMHLSVAIAFIMLFIRKIFGKRRIGFFIAILIAIFITLVCGGGASVVRALMMCSLFYLSHILYRENDSLTSLFNAFWIMMLINPCIIFNVGFVFSTLSVLGLILFGKKLSLFLKRFLPEKVATATSLTLAAQLALTPVIVYYFGIITPYAPFSNIVAVPLSSIYVVVGMLLVLLSPIEPIAFILSRIMNFLAAGIKMLCELISSLPYAIIDYEGNFIAFALMWVFLVFLVHSHPSPTKKMVKRAAVFAVAAIFLAFVSGKSFDTITFTPYGNETLAQVKTKEGSFLLDCPDIFDLIYEGASYENIVITGGDIQDSLNTKRIIKRIYLPEALYEEEIREKLSLQAKECDTQLFFRKDGEKFSIAGAVLRYIAIGGIENTRALELNIGNEKVITLQGLSLSDVRKMAEKRIVLSCDYLYIPQQIPEKEALTSGEIISNNKFLLQR